MSRDTDPLDRKGLIREAYLIDGIGESECRSIFVDWALSHEAADARPAIAVLLARYGTDQPNHPMTAVLRDGLEPPKSPTRRGGAMGRRG